MRAEEDNCLPGWVMKGELTPIFKKKIGRQGRKKGQHVERHSDAKEHGTVRFNVAGPRKHVQDQQEGRS